MHIFISRYTFLMRKHAVNGIDYIYRSAYINVAMYIYVPYD
jgi:hypothetical protein